MRHRVLRFLSIISIISLLSSSIVVYATEEESTNGVGNVVGNALNSVNNVSSSADKQANIDFFEQSLEGTPFSFSAFNFNEIGKEAFVQVFCDAYTTLQSKGVPPAVSAGILANAFRESNMNPYQIQYEYSYDEKGISTKMDYSLPFNKWESNNTTVILPPEWKVNYDVTAKLIGNGLFQWTNASKDPETDQYINYFGRATNFYLYGGANQDKYSLKIVNPNEFHLSDGLPGQGQVYPTKELYFPSTTNQVVYALEEKGVWSLGALASGEFNDIPFSDTTLAGLGIDESLAELSFSEFLAGNFPNSDLAITSAVLWEIGWERQPKENVAIHISEDRGYVNYIDNLVDIVNAIDQGAVRAGASTSVSNMTSDERDSTMTAMSKSGFWTESQISAYCRLTEIDVNAEWLAEAKRANLSQKELYNLTAWEENVEVNRVESILVKGGRRIILFVGILFEIWSILIYLAYWFDRVNNLFYIDAVGLLTFRKLRISQDYADATFSIHDGQKHSVKTVNHRSVLFIAVLGLTLGTLIVSGRMFSILYWVYMKAYNFFS